MYTMQVHEKSLNTLVGKWQEEIFKVTIARVIPRFVKIRPSSTGLALCFSIRLILQFFFPPYFPFSFFPSIHSQATLHIHPEE